MFLLYLFQCFIQHYFCFYSFIIFFSVAHVSVIFVMPIFIFNANNLFSVLF